MAISLRTKAGLVIIPQLEEPVEIAEDDYYRISEAFFIEAAISGSRRTFMRDHSALLVRYAASSIAEATQQEVYNFVVFSRDTFITGEGDDLGGSSVIVAWEEAFGEEGTKHFCMGFEL